MGKYNLEDSMEFQNLKKYAEEALKMSNKDAALEAILLEYSKDDLVKDSKKTSTDYDWDAVMKQKQQASENEKSQNIEPQAPTAGPSKERKDSIGKISKTHTAQPDVAFDLDLSPLSNPAHESVNATTAAFSKLDAKASAHYQESADTQDFAPAGSDFDFARAVDSLSMQHTGDISGRSGDIDNLNPQGKSTPITPQTAVEYKDSIEAAGETGHQKVIESQEEIQAKKKKAELLELAFGTGEFQEQEQAEQTEQVGAYTQKFGTIKPLDDQPEPEPEPEPEHESRLKSFFKRKKQLLDEYVEDDYDEADQDVEAYDEDEEVEEEPAYDESDDEYLDPELTMCDADEYDEIYDRLQVDCKSSRRRLFLSALFAALLIAMNVIDHFAIAIPSFFDISNQTIMACITMVLVVVMIVFNAPLIKRGAKNLITKRTSASGIMFVSMMVVFVHTGYSFVMHMLFETAFLSYAGAIAFAMFLYSLGRHLWNKSHFRNFECIYEASSSISEVRNIKDDDELLKIARRFVNDDPENFYYKSSVGSTGGFLSHAKGGENDISFRKRTVGLILLVLVVLSFLLSFLRGFENTVMIVVSMFAMVAPATFELAGSLVFSKATAKARSEGSVISGLGVARERHDVEAILLKDSDIFKEGSVVIKGMRVISSENINDIIADVASVFVTIDSPAKFAFLDLIDNKEKLLKQVYFFECYESEGIIAFIDGVKILLGSSEFMVKNGVIPPAGADKFFKGGKARTNMYVAQNGQMSCVFSMGYLLDKDVDRSLKEMEREYVRGVISTYDPNFNAQTLCKRFSLQDDSLSVMRPTDVTRFQKTGGSKDKIGRSGVYLIKRSATSFIGLVNAMKSISFLSRTNHLIMVAAMIAAPVLLSLLVFLNGVSQITPFAIVLFHALWSIPVFINSLFA